MVAVSKDGKLSPVSQQAKHQCSFLGGPPPQPLADAVVLTREPRCILRMVPCTTFSLPHSHDPYIHHRSSRPSSEARMSSRVGGLGALSQSWHTQAAPRSRCS